MADYYDQKDRVVKLLLRLLAPRPSYKKGKRQYSTSSAGGYISRGVRTPTYSASKYKEESRQKPEPKPKAEGYSLAKPWSESMHQSIPRERLVYDPEVKDILKNIEKKVGRELDAEEMLTALESNPSLYDKISGPLFEKMEREFNEQLEAGFSDGEKAEKAQEASEINPIDGAQSDGPMNEAPRPSENQEKLAEEQKIAKEEPLEMDADLFDPYEEGLRRLWAEDEWRKKEMLEQEVPVPRSRQLLDDLEAFYDYPDLPQPEFHEDVENYTDEKDLKLEALADTTGAGDRGYINFEPIAKPDQELSAPEPLTDNLGAGESLLGQLELAMEPLAKIEAQDISPLEAEFSLEALEPIGEPIEARQEAVEG